VIADVSLDDLLPDFAPLRMRATGQFEGPWFSGPLRGWVRGGCHRSL